MWINAGASEGSNTAMKVQERQEQPEATPEPAATEEATAVPNSESTAAPGSEPTAASTPESTPTPEPTPTPTPAPTPEPKEPDKTLVTITHYVCNDNPDCGYDTTDMKALIQHMMGAHGGVNKLPLFYSCCA
jgi:hypothetical protein